MERKYNSKAFTPEEVEKGLDKELIDYLLDYNKKSVDSYYDIHITTDGYCRIIEWTDVNYKTEFDCGKFEFVDSDQYIMLQKELPDNTYIFVNDEEEYQEQLKEFLEKNPTYKQNEWGIWYDERDTVDIKELMGDGDKN